MSAALRLIQTTPSMRPLGAAFGGVALAGVLLAVLTVGQIAKSPADAATAPAQGPAIVAHDRGWSAAASGNATGAVLFDRGWATAPGTTDSSPVGTSAGDAGSSRAGGANGTRFAR
jgi:hypothetical protein